METRLLTPWCSNSFFWRNNCKSIGRSKLKHAIRSIRRVNGIRIVAVLFDWQSRGKAKKFASIFLSLEMLRESTILVSFWFDCAHVALASSHRRLHMRLSVLPDSRFGLLKTWRRFWKGLVRTKDRKSHGLQRPADCHPRSCVLLPNIGKIFVA